MCSISRSEICAVSSVHPAISDRSESHLTTQINGYKGANKTFRCPLVFSVPVNGSDLGVHLLCVSHLEIFDLAS